MVRKHAQMLSFLHKKIVSLWNIIKLKKRFGVFGIVLLFTVLLTGWFFYTDQVSATIVDTAQSLSLAMSDITLWVAGLLLKLTIFVLKFIIELGGYNGYLDSPAVTIGWVMVRDVVNMGFVIILLVIAFGTILGLEQYEWKKMIVKFVLAAILVNFSRTICGLIIDAAQVVMTTFINGVAATAGGNLIDAFHADKIMSLSNGVTPQGIDAQAVFVASIAALVFTVMMLATMSIYLIILLFRMISLWVLIVLSPIAFVTSVIPQTQKYASEWWKEFSNNVISGPLLIFFLWLSFVTLGSGNIHGDYIGNTVYNSNSPSALITGEDGGGALGDVNKVGQVVGTKDGGTGSAAAAPAAGITSVMTWDSMANFFIALAMLLVGAKKAQELGTMGSSMLGKVSDIGKKAFMVASGVGGGLWAAKMAGKGVKQAAYYMPFVGGRALTTRAKNEWANVKSAWYGKAAGLSKEGLETTLKAGEANAEAARLKAEAASATDPGQKEELLKKANAAEVKSAELQKLAETQIGGGGLIGFLARHDIGQQKQLKKSQGQAEIREKLAFKRVAGDSGGVFFNRNSEQKRDAYRYEKGLLEVEEMRSGAKDKELTAKGKSGALSMLRYRDGAFMNEAYYNDEKGNPVNLKTKEDVEKAKREGKDVKYPKSMVEQIAVHDRTTAKMENITKAVRAGVELKIDLKAKEKVDSTKVKMAEEDSTLLSPEEKGFKSVLSAQEQALVPVLADIDKKYKPQLDEAAKSLEDPAAEFNKAVLDAEEKLKNYRDKQKDEDKKKEPELTRLAAIESDKTEALVYLDLLENDIKKLEQDYQKEIRIPGKTPDELQKIRDKYKSDFDSKQKEIKETEGRITNFDKELSTTEEEKRLVEEVAAAKLAKKADPKYIMAENKYKEVEVEKEKKVEEAKKPVVAARIALKEYREGPEKIKYEASDAYKKKKAGVDATKTAMEDELRGVLGVGGYMASQRAAELESLAAGAKSMLQASASELESMTQAVSMINLGEQGKKAGEEFVKAIKDKDLSKSFKLAREQVDKVIEKWKKVGVGNIENLNSEMRKASTNNAYVDALNQAEKGKVVAKDKNMREAQAADVVANAVVNIRKGRELPSEAIDALYESEAKELSGMERADASAAVADTMFYLMSRKDAGHELDADEKTTMMGGWGKIDSESWNDDFTDYFIRMVSRSRTRDETLTGQKAVIAQQMNKYATEMKMEFDAEPDKNGNLKFKGAYNRGTSSMWQGLAASGGDTRLWKAHNAINQEEKTMGRERFEQEGGYWGAAQRLASKKGENDTNALGYESAEKMEEAYREHQDGFKYAARKFKANGIGNGHWESVLNQEYDDHRGVYRMNTMQTAEAGSVTEMGKRTLNELLKFQNHSAGDFDLTTGLMQSIKSNLFGALTAQMKTDNDVKFMNFRSIIKMLGGHESETSLRSSQGIGADGKQTNFYSLGGERMLKNFIEDFGESVGQMGARNKMDDHLLEDFLVPELIGNKTATMLLLQRTMNLNDEDTAHGNFNIKFDGDIGQVSGFRGLVKMIKEIRKNGRLGNIDDGMMKQLEAMQDDFTAGVVAQTGNKKARNKSDAGDFGGP